MPQSTREKNYLAKFESLSLEEKRRDYHFALRFLAALLAGKSLPSRRRRRTIKRLS